MESTATTILNIVTRSFLFQINIIKEVPMSRLLYQFPISHYCEKVRWAMDHKRLEYKVKNLLPGFHLRTTQKIAPKSYLPILIDSKSGRDKQSGSQQIQNSHMILNYLDEAYPDKSLTPKDPELLQQALEWEKYCDIEIGIHVRCYSYHYLLSHPKIVVPLLTQDGSWLGSLLFKLSFSKIEKIMRKVMRINEASAIDSEAHIQQALDTLYEAYQKSEFLVGDQFSRADLAAASLLAPLIMPEGYGLDWPETVPETLQNFVDKNESKLARVRQIYQQFR